MVVLIYRPPGVQILAARGQFELVHGRALGGARLADWNDLVFREMAE